MTRNIQLRQAVEAWLQASLPILENRIGPEPLDHGRARREYWRLLWSIVTPEGGIATLPEAESLRAIIVQSPETATALLGTEDSPAASNSLPKGKMSTELTRFVLWYLIDTAAYSFAPDAFERLYQQLEQYIYDLRSITVQSLVELWNLDSEVDPIELDPGVVLRRTTDEERRRSEEDSLESRRFAGWFSTPPTPQVVLELRYRAGDLGEQLFPEILLALMKEEEEASKSVLLGLRLLKPGQIALGSSVVRSDNPIFPTAESHPLQPDPSWLYAQQSTPYVITTDDARDLIAYWPRLKRKSGDRRLSLAVRRFEGSYGRAELEDQLIDHWIALEALFLPDGSQELVYRASLRIARYLGASQDERLALFDAARASYELRSTLVHGKSPKPKHNLSVLANETAQLLRRVLRRCIADGMPPNITDLHTQLLD